MPRQKQPPRLRLREREGAPVWYIIDGPARISTGEIEVDGVRAYRGEATEARGRAEIKLNTYRAEKWEAPTGSRRADAITCGDILAVYIEEHGATVRSPETIGYAVKALAPFWSDLRVIDVKTETCKRYQRERHAAGVVDSTVRRELGTLAAAIEHCRKSGLLLEAPAMWRPPEGTPRNRWLTREEGSRLIRESRQTPHLFRYVWIGLMTGTRTDATLRLQWTENTQGGHIDLENLLLYRKSAFQAESKKRQPPARLDPEIAAPMFEWRSNSRRYVVEWRGDPVASIKNAFRKACTRAGLGADVTPHILRHSAITWAMQSGQAVNAVSSYFGITLQELERTYNHHHPDHQKGVGASLVRGLE